MKKKSLKSLIFACALLVFLPSCKPKEESHDKIKVITTFTVIADMAQNVAGDAATIESITKPGAEIHDYDPTPQDIVRALDADAIFWNGLNLERWFERFLQDVNNVPNYTLTEGVEPLSIYEGPYSGKPNPHAWMSPANALIYIDNIKTALIELDPENAQVYETNAARYAAQINDVRKELETTLENIPPEQRILVTSEGAFSYLARDFGMEEAYLWPINADQQGTPDQVRALIDRIRARNIPVLFSESTVSDKPAKQIAAETGAQYGGILYVDSLSTQDGPVPTYLDLLRVTTGTIAAGFDKAQEVK